MSSVVPLEGWTGLDVIRRQDEVVRCVSSGTLDSAPSLIWESRIRSISKSCAKLFPEQQSPKRLCIVNPFLSQLAKSNVQGQTSLGFSMLTRCLNSGNEECLA